MFTIGNWVLLGILLVMGAGILWYIWDNVETKTFVIVSIVIVILIAAIMCGIGWYNTHTAAGARALKDYQSNMSNGIERTLKVVADDGYTIYEREGKFDIEVHDDYIVFDEKGARTILYRSYTSTLVIEEKGD